MSARRLAAGLTVVTLYAGAAFAQVSPQLRVGTHPTYARIVYDWPTSVPYRLTQEGERVTLDFDGAGQVPGLQRRLRNTRAVEGGQGRAVLTIAPGTTITHMRLGNRVVVDIHDPTQAQAAAAPPATRAVTPSRGVAAASAPLPIPPMPPAPQTETRTVVAATPIPASPSAFATASARPTPTEMAPLPRIEATAAPAVAAPVQAAPLASAPDPVILAPDTAGTALFLRAGRLVAVVEQGRLAPGTVLPEGAEAITLPDGVLVSLRTPSPDARPLLERTRGGWRLTTGQGAPGQPVMVQTLADPLRLHVALPLPGGVLAVPDPEDGRTLLVGTQRGPAAVLEQGRVFPEFQLLPSLRGTVVVPTSDRIALRAGADGFEVLYSGPGEGALALETSPQRPGSEMSVRIFDFPADDLAALQERLKRQIVEAGTLPPLSRGRARADAAETMLAMGLAPEAQAMLWRLAAEDPRVGRSLRVRALSAAAALVAGRVEEAAGLNDRGLGEGDEAILWRGALAAASGNPLLPDVTARAAARLLPNYPAALRRRLVPLITEALFAQRARQEGLTVLAALPDEPSLAYARALAREAAGDSEGALALHAALAEGRDWRVRARALRRIVEIRRGSGALSAASAADALERQLFGWRGDALERSLRERVAELRQEAGDTRAALIALRETITLFPEDAARLRPRISALLAELPDRTGSIPAVELVSLIEGNADALPEGAEGAALAKKLAEALLTLDLPERAAAVYERMLPNLPAGALRSEVGLALAELKVGLGNGEGALAALAASAPASALSEQMILARGMVAARAEIVRGQRDAANRILEELPGPDAALLRAEQDFEQEIWDGALRRTLAVLPFLHREGTPADARFRRAVVQAAVAAAMNGDRAALDNLASQYGALLDGTDAETVFRSLTGAPVADVSSLPSLAREFAAMRAVVNGGTARP